jgi:DNA-binding response OmpR family regulator
VLATFAVPTGPQVLPPGPLPGPALVIEPNESDRHRICTALTRAGIEAVPADSYEEAPRRLFAVRPKLVLLAADPPADSAWATLAAIRELTDAPVVVLSALDSELGAVRALRAGADDYMTKPLALGELVARVEAIGRRLEVAMPETEIDDGVVAIDLRRVEARADGKLLRLTPLEFRLLLTFARNPNQVLSRSHLLDLVWGDNAGYTLDRVKLAVSYLRNRFREAGVQPPIETVRGWGYLYRTERPPR